MTIRSLIRPLSSPLTRSLNGDAVSGGGVPTQGTATGGTITEAGGYRIHTFLSSADTEE